MSSKGGTGISIGSFDLGVEVIENRVQLMVMDQIIRRLVERSSLNITQKDIEDMRKDAIEKLNKEYPELGIQHQG